MGEAADGTGVAWTWTLDGGAGAGVAAGEGDGSDTEGGRGDAGATFCAGADESNGFRPGTAGFVTSPTICLASSAKQNVAGVHPAETTKTRRAQVVFFMVGTKILMVDTHYGARKNAVKLNTLGLYASRQPAGVDSDGTRSGLIHYLAADRENFRCTILMTSSTSSIFRK